ncbi:unnamed protein product [Urochloa decumbens]|uniref:F-box domain-containing protein n=1 Tax=Urochloa decumbens TaxID=240449 RepID=A0ABC9BQZ6_9POAL
MPPPSPRRPCRGGRLGERDGPRSVPPVRIPEREGRHRQGERDGPRAPPSTPRRGRTLERQRRHGRYRDEKDGPHAAPSTPQRVHDFEAAARGWSPSFSPTSDGTYEKEGSDDDQIVASQYQHDEDLVDSDDEALMATEKDGSDGEEAEALVAIGEESVAAEAEEDGRDGGEADVVAIWEEPVVVEEDGRDGEEVEQANENPRDHEAVEAVTHILDLPDEMLSEIVNKLSASDLCRTVCSCRSILRAVRRGYEVQKRVPFVAAVVMNSIVPAVVTMKKAVDSRQVQHSVSYIRESILQMPVETQIVDCRSGHLLLRRNQGEFYVWNPLLRRTDWVPVPRCEVDLLERFVAAALIPGEIGEYYVVVMFATEPNNTLKVFSSITGTWRTADIAISEHHVHPFSVYTGGCIYFLCLTRGKKSVIKIDLCRMTGVAIPMPPGFTDGEMMISCVSNKLCLCKVERRRVKGKRLLVCLQLKDDQWIESWIHNIPEDSYWTRLMGFGEENGILIVGTGTVEIKILKIEDGVWVDMESCKIHPSAALEMENPFSIPFLLQRMEIGDHHFKRI